MIFAIATQSQRTFAAMQQADALAEDCGAAPAYSTCDALSLDTA